MTFKLTSSLILLLINPKFSFGNILIISEYNNLNTFINILLTNYSES